ncbi:nicotinate-nucleotide adenylyltransferase [Sinanaerobacter chloroacetimidivorans]|jgi:nicotinate-nucleotide adenylyltransferase|uniref:Probable nicotinate-nucleotide adenylyltransferase n=1 Tax=Sinanaerobacter chloroacetimidivorans TaxID=2818044 RepID=A0A8J7VZ33_9FIRM|nr:nicotinate-nucleotide adenylyltransferase [Sinanaerobacter chloroacetimidivorans]MBR0596653.1 nicotinate-nucleotide adenylyltransferase [Sinanaerobacter chloroacetimidivorans]
MKKIGILGGTFDPVHYGHLILAEQARGEAGLDQVVFMPAMVQPFKLNTKIAEGHHRYAMLMKATAGNAGFAVSDLELTSAKVSYTIKTLQEYKSRLDENTTLYFIIGTDAFLSIDKWFSAEDLLKEYSFIVGTRPGYKEKELKEKVERFREIYDTQILQIKNSEVEISSSDIKDRIRKGKSIKYLLPEAVEDYIYQEKLYL